MEKSENRVREDLFWDLANEMYVDPMVERGTMMGFPCLRVNGQFFASLDKDTNHMIVKLPAAAVTELVASGRGLSFAPNGRVFREWVAIPIPGEDEWRRLLGDAKAFVDG